MKKSLLLNKVVTCFFAILTASTFMATAQLFGYFTNALIDKKDSDSILFGSLILACCFLFALSKFTYSVYLEKTSRQIVNKTKMQKIQNFSSTEQLSKFREDMIVNSEEVISLYYKNIYDAIYSISSIAYGVIATVMINWIVGLVILGFSVLIFLLVMVGSNKSKLQQKNLVKVKNEFNTKITVNLNGYMEFAYANRTRSIDEVLKSEIQGMKQSTTKFSKFVAFRSAYVSSLAAFSSSIITLTVGLVVMNHHANYGSFVSALATSGMIFGSVNTLSIAWLSRKSIKDVRVKFLSINKLESEAIEEVKTITLNNIAIAFDDKTILKDFSLEIKPNAKILISAPSGTGKSSLLRVISGELIPSSGEVLINSKVIKSKFTSNDIKLMQNDFEAYDFTLNELIKDEQYIREFELEGIQANACSKGQLQKIKIAHMLSGGANIQLYDEPFSNIDKDSLGEVFEKVIGQNKTIIVAAHNLDKKLISQFDFVINL